MAARSSRFGVVLRLLHASQIATDAVETATDAVETESRTEMTTANTRHAVVNTPLGDVTLVATGPALAGIYFAHHWYQPNRRNFGRLVPAASDSLLSATAGQLDEYFRRVRDLFDLPVQTHGDEFQERV